jgi:hypothetical protein
MGWIGGRPEAPPQPAIEQMMRGGPVKGVAILGVGGKKQGGACTVLDCELAGRSLHMAGNCLLQKQSPFPPWLCVASGGLGGCSKRPRPRNLQAFGGLVVAAGERKGSVGRRASRSPS